MSEELTFRKISPMPPMTTACNSLEVRLRNCTFWTKGSTGGRNARIKPTRVPIFQRLAIR